MSEPAIIVINHTIMDGIVVRWYRDLKAYEVFEPVLSASRNGWVAHDGKRARVPAEWSQAAREAHAALKEDPTADMSHLATHRPVGRRSGLLIPIQRERE